MRGKQADLCNSSKKRQVGQAICEIWSLECLMCSWFKVESSVYRDEKLWLLFETRL